MCYIVIKLHPVFLDSKFKETFVFSGRLWKILDNFDTLSLSCDDLHIGSLTSMAPNGWLFFIAVVFAFLAILIGVKKQFDYGEFCDISCMEAAVNKYRIDPWDVLFIRSRICHLIGFTECRNDFYVANISQDSFPWEYEFCRYRDDTEDTEDCYKISTNFKEERLTVRQFFRDADIFYNSHNCLFYHMDMYMSINITEKVHMDNVDWLLPHIHRRVRYTFFDLLDLGLGRNVMPFIMSITFDGNIEEHLSKSERINLITLLIILLNYDKENFQMNVHTDIFDQSRIILSDGSVYHAYFVIWMSFVSLSIAFYFVHKNLQYLLSPRLSFSFDPQLVPNRRIKLSRPDLICVGSDELNIFSSYFWQGILNDHGFWDSSIAMGLVFVIAYFSNEAGSQNIWTPWGGFDFEPWEGEEFYHYLSYIIIFVSGFLLAYKYISIFIVFVFGFVLSFFVQELLFKFSYILQKTSYSLTYEKFCWFLILSLLFFTVGLFSSKSGLVGCLNGSSLCDMFLWPTWPVQMLVCVSQTLKKRFRCPNYIVTIVWIIVLFSTYYVGCMHIPGLFRYFYFDYEYGKLYTRHLNLSIMGYWIYIPVFLIIKFPACIFSNNICHMLYNRIARKIMSMVFSFCVTLFCVYLCNFYLFQFYPILKEITPGSSFLTLWIPLIFQLSTYIVEVRRNFSTVYENFLKAVISHVESGTASDWNQRNKSRLEVDDNELIIIYRDSGEYEIIDDKYYVKGLFVFIKDCKYYIPADFFFKVIKLPGAPGSMKTVIVKEILDLFLRLFPGLSIFWARETVQMIEMEKYEMMLQAILNNTLLLMYKGLFLQKKAKTYDINKNSAMQVQIDRFIQDYKSWAFLSEQWLCTCISSMYPCMYQRTCTIDCLAWLG